MFSILRRNLGIKIASVIIAALFWLFVMNQKTPDMLISDQPLTIYLETTGLPKNMVVMTQLPLVRVRLQGITGTNIKDIYAQVDLSNGEVGEHSYVVKVNSPLGTNVLDIQPASVILQLDAVQERSLPVNVIVSGVPAEGYHLGTSYVKPSAVNVRGPSTILSALNNVFVEVSVMGASETIQGSRPISIRNAEGNPIIGPNPGVEFLSALPNTVDVIVPVIAESLASKSVPLKVTSSGTPAEGRVLRALIPSQASVQILGAAQSLAGIDSLDLGSVDVTDLKEDKVFQIDVEKIQLPPGVSLYEGTDISVVAQIEGETIQKEIAGVEVQVQNLGANLVLEKSIAPLNVVTEGKSDVLENVTPDQIQLWVDAADQPEGTYTDVEVFWELPAGVTLTQIPQVSYSLKAVPAEME